MSFIIALHVREGMVMASDSRLSLNMTRPQEGKQVSETAICQSDAVHKTFLAQERIGVSAYGAADLQGVPTMFKLEEAFWVQRKELHGQH